MPTSKQISANTDKTNFAPVRGGRYYVGYIRVESTHGYWWGSEAYNDATRYRLAYDSSDLYSANLSRGTGIYIRCVSEEKTVLDLTYMQDNDGEKGGGLWAYKT